jgi:glycine C-acetyltransferase
MESIPGLHTALLLLVSDILSAKIISQPVFEGEILAFGRVFPTDLRGEKKIRFYVNAAHTNQDIDYVLKVLPGFKDWVQMKLRNCYLFSP